jgi:hypothetical protein
MHEGGALMPAVVAWCCKLCGALGMPVALNHNARNALQELVEALAQAATAGPDGWQVGIEPDGEALCPRCANPMGSA